MADKNVLSIAFDTTSTTNYESSALFVQKLAPRNVNVSAAGIPSGDVIFEFNTPKDTFCDLFKTYMSMEYTVAGGANTLYVHKQTLLSCMFQRATVYLNGVKISSSNNYTQDGMLSRRLQFGKSYNQSVNGVYDLPSIADDHPGDTTPGAYISTDTLDSFWLRQSEGLMVPPNSNVRMEFTIDANYQNKSVLKTTQAAAVLGGLVINHFWMHPCMYVNPSEVKGDSYRLRFISLNSFMSQLGAQDTSKIMQYTVNPTIVKACLTHLPNTYQTVADGARKWEAAYLFNSGTSIRSLQFKVGNVVYPQTPYSFNWGMEEAYQDYINHTQQVAKDSGKENYTMYANGRAAPDRNNWGPIFIAPIVKDRSDPTNTLEVTANYIAPGEIVFTILTSLEEQSVEIAMEGLELRTTPTI